MKPDLFSALEARMDEFTPSERKIANYILNNKRGIPFETAASLAGKLDISSVTVGRFCRGLGYEHFRALKQDLRNNVTAPPWLVGDELVQFIERYDDKGQLRRSLELEIASLVEVYQMVGTPEWKAVVNLVVKAQVVQVVGFQTERGLGHMLTNSLQLVRDGVELVRLDSGHYAEVFARSIKKRCLILIDIDRYSRQTYLMAEKAAADSIPLIMITDKYCDWARRFTSHVLAVPTESGQFWESNVPIACLINLLINSVVARSGSAVEKRLDQFSELFDHFTGFVGPAHKHKRAR